MQIQSTSAICGSGQPTARAENGESRSAATDDFDSMLSAMREAESQSPDTQKEESAETVDEDIPCDDTECAQQQDVPPMGSPELLSNARKELAADSQVKNIAASGRASDFRLDVVATAFPDRGAADLPGAPQDGRASTLASASHALIVAKGQAVAENHIPAAMLQAEEPGAASQPKTDFAMLHFRSEATAESASSNPAVSGHPIRQAAQGIEILMRHPDKPVEIALNPEELGRVRMALTRTETGMTVAILADRPETLDLMRRHIDQLAAEFERLGYTDIGFSFGADTQQGRDTQGRSRRHADTAVAPAESAQLVFLFNRPVTDGLDLRL